MGTTLNIQDVALRARAILKQIEDSEFYLRLKGSAMLYESCWATFSGYPIVREWDQRRDAEPLFDEALRVLALKTAVFELSGGDEARAELIISAPVDEMVHAVLAQYTLCGDIERALGLRFVHMTDQERFGYEPGNWAHQLYVAAYGQEPPERYWTRRTDDWRSWTGSTGASACRNSGSATPSPSSTSWPRWGERLSACT